MNASCFRLVLVAGLLPVLPTFSALPISDFSVPYLQNFDSLGPPALINENTTGEIRIWEDNVTLPGWYARMVDAAGLITPVNGGDGLGLRYVSGNGAAFVARVPSIRNYGRYTTDNLTGSPTDRALGLVVGTTTNQHSAAMGVALRNASADRAVSAFTVTLRHEQWRRSAGGGMVAAYAVRSSFDADSMVSPEDWTAIPALAFPAATGSNSGLDGNLNGYSRVALVELPTPSSPVSC